MERRRATTDGRAWQLILTQELDRLLPQLRESADGPHRVLWRNATRDEKRTLLDILVRIASNLDKSRTDAESDICLCRSDEHKSDLTSLMRIAYAVYRLKKK